MGAMETLSDRIKADILGIRSFNDLKDNEGKYELIPIEEWTEEICKELNKVDFLRNYCLAQNDKLRALENKELTEFLEKNFANLQKREGGKYKIKKVYIYDQLKVSFVRFNHCIILKKESNETNLYSEIESSIIENLGIVAGFDIIKKKLLEQTVTPSCEGFDKEQYFESLKQLTEICAVSAMFSLNKRPENGEDNCIWYELLQNANDHIPPDTKDKILEIKFDEEARTFTLKYPDKGFSVRDFLAICTEGNSGNVLSEEDREGRKGTGFKSVYNLFDEVTIISGPVQCVLSDYPREISIKKEKNDIEISEINKKNGERCKKYYPIPVFSKVETGEQITTLTFHCSTEKFSSIMKSVFGDNSQTSNTGELLEKFKEKRDFLFLDNISIIRFDFCNETVEFNRAKYIEDKFYRKEYSIEQEKIKKEGNPTWKDRSDELFGMKRKCIFLFPQQLPENDSVIESRVYCTLPIDELKLNIPFCVNIPLLELKDNRKSLANELIDNYDLKAWNEQVLKEGLFKGFKTIVEDPLENNIGLSGWYRYFPYAYLRESVFGLKWSDDLRKVKFLRVTTSTCKGGENVNCASISDMVQKDTDIQDASKSIFLPCGMYEWIHKNINDIFESKCSGENNSIRPVSFVYYDYESKNEDNLIENIIKEKIDYPRKALSYLCEEEEKAVLLELNKYLLNDYKKSDSTREDFYGWLKKLLTSDDYRFLYKKVFIYRSFLKSNGVDYSGGKYHWLENDDESYCDEEIAGYKPINGIINEMKKQLYPEDYCFQQDEKYSIICCFEDLIESPYIKYTYEIRNGSVLVKTPKLRTIKDEILPVQNRENKIPIDQILCYYTEELLKSELEIGTAYGNDGWYKENKVLLYVENRNEKIIQVSNTVYYCDKNIPNDSVVGYGKNFFMDLKEALSNSGNFFDVNKGNEVFVKQVLESYDISDWKEQAITFISNPSNSKEGIQSTIFRYIISKSNEPIDWHESYSGLVKELTVDELWQNGKVVFHIKDMKNINKLPQYVLDIFDNKVSLQEKDKIIADETIQEIVSNNIYILPCKTGNKSLYCKARIPDGNTQKQREIYLLFSENAFGTILRNVFDCHDFSDNKIYNEMSCNDIDMLRPLEVQMSEELILAINSKVDELIEKWMAGEKEDIKKALVNRFDVRCKGTGKWFHARGYGDKDYSQKKCPICRGILLSEMNLLTIRNITCNIFEQKYYFPMLMCKNCGESINYTENVELDLSECDKEQSDIFKVDDNSFAEFRIIFSMTGREEKSLNCEISFLNRYIWKRIKESRSKDK